MDDNRPQERGPEDVVVRWILRIAAAAIFVSIGLGKFTRDPKSEWVRIFQQIGFGAWFRYFTGAIEALGGALFLVPRATFLGAMLLVTTMLGAIVAHVFVLGDPVSVVIPLALGAGVVAVSMRVGGGRAA